MSSISALRFVWLVVAGYGSAVLGQEPSPFGPQRIPAPPPGLAKAMTIPSDQPDTSQKLDRDVDSQEQPISPGRDIQNTEKGRIKMPNISVSKEKTDGYLIDLPVPKRFPIIADDPNSAWWESNPRVAFRKAQRQQRPLMLLFTSMSNAKCEKLSEEVFTTRTFNEYAKENLIICYLNYPRNIKDAPMSMREVKAQFKVNGYPNVLIFNPEGDVAHEITGYRTGRPVDYFQRLKETLNPELLRINEEKSRLRGYGFRDWKNETGQIVFGKFVRHDGELLTLTGPHRENWTVTIKSLSRGDQGYLQTFPSIDEIAKMAH